MFRIAKHIIEEERNQYTHTNESQQSIHPYSILCKRYTENKKRNHTKAGSQSVYPINQIDGIGHENRQ